MVVSSDAQCSSLSLFMAIILSIIGELGVFAGVVAREA